VARCTSGVANSATRKHHPSFGIIHLTSEPTFIISLDHDRKINFPIQKILLVLHLCKPELWLLGSH